MEAYLEFRYRVIEVLNEQKQTLLVRDRLTGRVLVKRKFPLEMEETYLALKDMQCVNLVQIQEVYHLEDGCIVLEEYVNGCSVERLLMRGERLKAKEAKRVLLELCRGLSEPHEKHIVCRSVRPDKIRINQDGVVKLMDFSAGRKFYGEKPADTVLIGNAGYVAPEQYGFSESDGWTDIYAAGVLLNQLLTGKHPREGVYWRKRRLRKIILKCTQVDKKKRYENVAMLQKALEGPWGPSGKQYRNGEKEKLGFAQKFYNGLPGLRNGVWYWKVLALILYFVLVLLVYALIGADWAPGSGEKRGIYIFFEVLQFLVPAAIVFNAWNVSRFSWLPKLLRPQLRLVLAAVAWVVLDGIKEAV